MLKLLLQNLENLKDIQIIQQYRTKQDINEAKPWKQLIQPRQKNELQKQLNLKGTQEPKQVINSLHLCKRTLMTCPWPYRSLIAAQHFEVQSFTFRNRFSRAVSQENEFCDEREAQPNLSSISRNKASILAMRLQLQRQTSRFTVYFIKIIIN
ncbi:Hypothetical_protein [Hexamita inflata]|uniref:Hypothetical_protein n=1 Tax=Hexamita inflata TaxID=28002 RepID=A0AA86PPJ1_9EUKA|nr:Hypothetical protein HINF_LOCUS31625 [Hexamita inflata]